MKLIIGNRAYSSWSMRGWLALKQSELEFEELVVPLFDEAWEKRREGDEFAPSLGKVPILWDNDCVVRDSLAIIDFLADRVGRDREFLEIRLHDLTRIRIRRSRPDLGRAGVRRAFFCTPRFESAIVRRPLLA